MPTDRALRLLHLRGEGRLAGGDVHVESGSTVAADEDADFERGSRFVVGGAHDAHGRLAGGLAQQAGLVLAIA